MGGVDSRSSGSLHRKTCLFNPLCPVNRPTMRAHCFRESAMMSKLLVMSTSGKKSLDCRQVPCCIHLKDQNLFTVVTRSIFISDHGVFGASGASSGSSLPSFASSSATLLGSQFDVCALTHLSVSDSATLATALSRYTVCSTHFDVT